MFHHVRDIADSRVSIKINCYLSLAFYTLCVYIKCLLCTYKFVIICNAERILHNFI